MSSLREKAGEAAHALMVFVGMGVAAILCVGNGVNTSSGFLVDFTAPIALFLGMYISIAVEERQLVIPAHARRVTVVFAALATLAVLTGQWYAIDPSPVTSGAAFAVIIAIPSIVTAQMYVDIPVFTRLVDGESKEVTA